MATALQKFRAKYPQYNDRDDEELAEALYKKHYSELDPAEFRRRIGLDQVEPPPEPTIGDRIDGVLRRVKSAIDPLTGDTDTDSTLTDLATVKEPEVDPVYSDWQKPKWQRGTVDNSLLLGAERGSALLGHAVRGFVGLPGDALDRKWSTGQIVFGTDWGPDDPADGKFRVRYMNPQEWDKYDQSRVANLASETIPGYLTSRDFGGVPRHTTEEIKKSYNNGEILGTLGSVFAFGVEQGIQSIPDMVAVMAGPLGLAAYAGARSDEMGETRAANTKVATSIEGIPGSETVLKHSQDMLDNQLQEVHGDQSITTFRGAVETWPELNGGRATLFPTFWNGKQYDITTQEGKQAVLGFIEESGGGERWPTSEKPGNEGIGEVLAWEQEIHKTMERQAGGSAEHTFQDNLEAAPFAIGSALFERLGAKAIVGAFGKKTAEQVGVELIQAGIKAAAKRIGKRGLAAAGTEAGTEAFQEGVLEYLGEKLGTDAPMSWQEAVERGFFGSLGGLVVGGTAGGVMAAGGEAVNAVDERVLIKDAEQNTDTPDADTAQPEPEPAPPDTDFDEEGNVVETGQPAPDAPAEPETTAEADIRAGEIKTRLSEIDGEIQTAAGEGRIRRLYAEKRALEEELSRLRFPEAAAADAQPDAATAPTEPRTAPEDTEVPPAPAEPETPAEAATGATDADTGPEETGAPPAPAETESSADDYTGTPDDYFGEVPREADTSDAPAQGYFDVRLKRESYRLNLAGMAQELVVGGGGMGALIRNEAYPGEIEIDGMASGEVTGRVPSENPLWFQELAGTDASMSVRQLQNAVEKALQGKRLGVRQARVVGHMLDMVTDDRTDGANIDYAREQLEAARARRRQARIDVEQQTGQALDPMDRIAEELAGERFDEREYLPEMDAEARIVDELAAEIDTYGEDAAERASIIIDGAASTYEAMQALEKYLNEQRTAAAGAKSSTVAQGGRSTAETAAAAGDLFGDDTRQAQALADEQRRRDAARNTGQTDLETGDPGDMFSQARDQVDIEDAFGPAERLMGEIGSLNNDLDAIDDGTYDGKFAFEIDVPTPDDIELAKGLIRDEIRAKHKQLEELWAQADPRAPVHTAEEQKDDDEPKPWQVSPTGKEWAGMSVDEIDRAAFGFAASDITELSTDQLEIKWGDDLANVEEKIRRSGQTPEQWAEGIDLSTPIDVIYEEGAFKVDDGHHRYKAAQILGKPLPVDVTIKDKPFRPMVERALAAGEEVHPALLEMVGIEAPASPGADMPGFDTTTTGMPVYDEYMDPSRGWYFEDKLDIELITITPDEYIRRMQEGFRNYGGTANEGTNIDQARVDKYAEMMRNGHKFPTLMLSYKAGFGQEGRHRAHAAKQAGIERVPVLVVKSLETKHRQDNERRSESRGQDRRADVARRERIATMSVDELMNELYTDEMTGLGNRRAFEETVASSPAVGSIDVDSLSGVNDNLGHDAGDGLIRAVGQALADTGADAYHISGDEFYILGETVQEVRKAIGAAVKELRAQVLESDKGKLTGIEITAGVGTDKASADSKMEAAKKAKEAAGKRAPKGVLPDTGIVYSKVLNMNPGVNYVGIIGQRGALPLNANHQYVLGNGNVVRIPSRPIRRRDIMAALQRRLGLKIYQGRVKGKTRLGFYRLGIGEVRIKNANDLEVTAHEISHWLDDRHPWISRLYKQFKHELQGVSYDDTNTSEGYAEFMRLWFTQDYMARMAAPGFYDAWMIALDGHPGLKAVVTETQEMMHAWHLQGARARLEDRYGKSDLSITERASVILDRIGDRFLQKVFDGLRPFKTIEKQVRGALANAAFSGYKTLRLARGANGVMQAILQRGTIAWDAHGDLVFNGKGIRAVFEPVSHLMVEMQNYMIARRAQELMQQGRENHLRPDEIRRGLQFGDQHPEIKEVFAEWLAFNQRMMDFYQQSGLLSGESRAAIDEMNRNYVPFNRIVDTALGENTKGRSTSSPFMRLKGGTQNINDVFESIVGNTAHMVTMSLTNMGKRNFYTMINAAARGGNQTAGLYATPIAKDVKPTQIDKDQVLKVVLEGLGLSMGWYRNASTGLVSSDAEAQLVDAITHLSNNLDPFVTFFQMGQDPKGNVDYYLAAGKKVWYEIGDPMLMEAINQIGPRQFNLAGNMLGGFANILRKGVTLTPTFQAKNFIRDTMNAFTLSKGHIVPAVAATQALVERLYNDEHYWEYMLNGGGFASMADADGINRDRVVDGSRNLMDKLDQGLGAFEYANRIAEFKALREKGMSARDAALAGREISSDFAMRGSSEILRWFTLSVPFMNARLQGLYRNGRELMSLEEGKLGFIGGQAFSYALRSLMSITIPSLILYALNKDDERYQELPDWVRDLSWVIFTGKGEDDYVMIPKPFETGMLWGTLPERMIEKMYDGTNDELADAMLWMALETFTMNIVPQAYKPWDELQKNKNFTGAPIIPEYLQDVEPMEQYRAYTSQAMIALGRKLNISPLKAEHLVRGYFGTLGNWALGLADNLVGDVTNSGEAPTKSWKDNILMSPFVDDGPLRRTHSENHLYDMLKSTQEIANTVRIISERSPERLEEYISEPRKQVLDSLNADLVGWAKEMRELNNAIDMVQADAGISADEKREQIFDLRRARNEISRAVRDNINPDVVQGLIDEAEASAFHQRAVGEK